MLITSLICLLAFKLLADNYGAHYNLCKYSVSDSLFGTQSNM